MQKSAFEQWVRGYLECWTHNDREAISDLFAEDCRYYTQAFREPWAGREVIVAGWLERADWQGEWDFDYRWVAIEGDTGVLEGLTTYHTQGSAYHNVWFITLDEDGKCTEFKEVWVEKPEDSASR
jgi:hypothetical protein